MEQDRESLIQWFELELWEYLNDGGHWIRRENEQWFYLRGAYIKPEGWQVALDWEQPLGETPQNSRISGQVGVILCFICGFVITLYENWHPAWVLLRCRSCGKRWYCISSRRKPDCPKCFPKISRFYDQERSHQETGIVKLVCGKKNFSNRYLGCVGRKLLKNYNEV